MSRYRASPVTQASTRMPSRLSTGVTPHNSPAMLYSPTRLTSSGVVNAGSAVPITWSSRTWPASRLPKFLLPAKPGAGTGITGIPVIRAASPQTAEKSSPIIAVTQVA